MLSAKDVFAVAAAIVGAVGGAGIIILGLSNWFGKIWSDRLLARERARTAEATESLKAELAEAAGHRQDVLTRRRNVYASLATSMRIFLGNSRLATDDQIAAFYRAYDESCLWASEPVVGATGRLLDRIVANTKRPGSVAQGDLEQLYQQCMLAMRRDSGFPDSDFIYRMVSF